MRVRLTLARKIEGSGTALQPLSVTSQPEWDRTTYRITKVDEGCDLPRLSQVIKSLFQAEDKDFKIHSLAFDASDEKDPRWKVATISFCVRPTLLQTSRVH